MMNEESGTDSNRNLPPPPRPVIAPITPPPVDTTPTSPPASGLPDENATARLNLGGHFANDDDSSVPTIAPFNTRVVAVVIDWVVATGLWIGLTWILPGFAEGLGWIVALAYFVARDTLPFLGGQSIGKKAMKIKAVTLEGRSLVGNWEIALIRNGVLVIPLFALVELYILLTREDKPEQGRRLGDEWAKTKVIPEPTPPDPAAVIP
jgi:uncharacterized RDD family membrane protein YckC